MDKLVPFTLFCLDCDCKTRESRLLKETDQPELVTEDMEYYAEVLRTETQKLGGSILDTGTLSPLLRQQIKYMNISKTLSLPLKSQAFYYIHTISGSFRSLSAQAFIWRMAS